jgi:hypothetical protein
MKWHALARPDSVRVQEILDHAVGSVDRARHVLQAVRKNRLTGFVEEVLRQKDGCSDC